jgi:hypothetical protein
MLIQWSPEMSLQLLKEQIRASATNSRAIKEKETQEHDRAGSLRAKVRLMEARFPDKAIRRILLRGAFNRKPTQARPYEAPPREWINEHDAQRAVFHNYRIKIREQTRDRRRGLG